MPERKLTEVDVVNKMSNTDTVIVISNGKIQQIQKQYAGFGGAQMRVSETNIIQYRNSDVDTWKDLISIDLLKGEKGDTGDTGDTGSTPLLTIGDVITVENGSQAVVTITGTPEVPVLNFQIPKGADATTDEIVVVVEDKIFEKQLVNATQLNEKLETKADKIAILSDDGEEVVRQIDLGFKMLEEEGNITKGQLLDRDTKGNLYPETTKEQVIGLQEDLDDINTEITNIKDTGVQVADTLPIGSVIGWDSEEPYPADIYEEVDYNPIQHIINPDFQVNQRGKTQYVSSTIPVLTVDMWAVNLLTVDVLERGIKITNNDVDRHSIYQKGLNLPKGDYTIVINVLEKTGTPSTQPFEILYYDEGAQVKYAKVIENIGLTTVSFNDSISQVAIAVPPSCTLTLEYVNLFEGDIVYPHVKNKYEDDLMECEEKNRYIVKALRQYLTFGIGVYYDGSIYMDTSIRNFPSGGIVTFDGKFTLFAIKGKENIELVTINSCVFDDLTGYLVIKFSNMSNLQNGDVFLIQTGTLNAFINVSCEPL